MHASAWIDEQLRRHHVPPADEVEGRAGTWRGAWYAGGQPFGFGSPLPFVLEMAIDAEGRLTGFGSDCVSGYRFRIDGTVFIDGQIARVRWCKTYAHSHEKVDYEGVLVDSAGAGHFVHRQAPMLCGTFALSRGEAAPVSHRYSVRAVMLAVFNASALILGLLSIFSHFVLPAFALLVASFACTIWPIASSRRLVRRSRRELAALAAGQVEPPQSLPPARLVKELGPLTPR